MAVEFWMMRLRNFERHSNLESLVVFKVQDTADVPVYVSKSFSENSLGLVRSEQSESNCCAHLIT